ncbi:MAG: membrane integrity-associated transporter subunit PqiC [Piscirickettsiaceae bacterium]|nr:membrane integrity-associated transporter subunit PqiC [Piscirickettsiaceae bacterium]
MNNRLRILSILIIISLAGCSVINQKSSPAIDVYTLSPLLEKESKITVDNAPVLALSPFRSSRGLMSSDIIYRDNEYAFNSYAYSRWSDSPAKLLEIAVQQSLSHRSYLKAVVPTQTGAHARLLLEATLLDFSHHIQGDEHSTGLVVIRFYLIDVQTKTILATKEFSAEVTAEPRNAQGATSAINLASKKVIEALHDWLEVQISHLSAE